MTKHKDKLTQKAYINPISKKFRLEKSRRYKTPTIFDKIEYHLDNEIICEKQL